MDVELTTDWQVGTASPCFGSRALSCLPFPGEMVRERTNMSLIYVSMDEKFAPEVIYAAPAFAHAQELPHLHGGMSWHMIGAAVVVGLAAVLAVLNDQSVRQAGWCECSARGSLPGSARLFFRRVKPPSQAPIALSTRSGSAGKS